MGIMKDFFRSKQSVLNTKIKDEIDILRMTISNIITCPKCCRLIHKKNALRVRTFTNCPPPFEERSLYYCPECKPPYDKRVYAYDAYENGGYKYFKEVEVTKKGEAA